jgi:hypothetical protein
MASGSGWAWVRDDDQVVHVTGARGPRGPITAVVDRVPVVAPGERLVWEPGNARVWTTPSLPTPAGAEEIASVCALVLPHRWNDPRALRLSVVDLDGVAAELVGRGPGLTPAGDDVLAGFAYTRAALQGADAEELAVTVRALSPRTSEPSSTLLRLAASGEVFAPAAAMLAALVSADAERLAACVRQLSRLGRTTGRALLTGMLQALADRGGSR